MAYSIMIISLSSKVKPLKSKYDFVKDKKLDVLTRFSPPFPPVKVISDKKDRPVRILIRNLLNMTQLLIKVIT